MNLKRGGDLAVGYPDHFGELGDQNTFGHFVVAAIARRGMAIQKHRALIARVNDFQTLRKYPQILQSASGGLHSPSILD
jgi:hypothetical protein